MTKLRIPLFQKPRNFATVEDGATKGARVGTDLLGPDGKVLTADQIINPATPAGSQNQRTVWKTILEIPANIRKIAALIGKGFSARQSDGEWALRTLQPGDGIEVKNGDGDAGDPVIGLADVSDSGAGTLQAVTVDEKGRVIGTRPATITGTAQQIDVANGTAAAGLPTISLADLPNTNVGEALVKITRDPKGRVLGTQAATTTDLTEGTNLYYTDGRADARINAQKGQPNGLAPLGADSKVPAAYLPTPAPAPVQSVNSRTGAVTVPDFVIKATTPTSTDFGRAIINGDRWFNSSTGISYTYNGGAWLSDGSSAPVSSVFGRTGSVVAQTGDYTAAQVGADPAGTAAGLAAGKYDKVGGTIGGSSSGSDPVRIEGNGAGYVGVDIVNLNTSTTTIARTRFVTSNKNVGFLAGGAGTVGQDGFSIYDYTLNTAMMYASATSVRPGDDNNRTLGTAGARWSVVYAGTGSINTSDAREKSPVRPLEPAEFDAAIQLGDEIGAFKWLASIEEKGDSARWHIGMTVQRAIAIMESHHLDPFAYGIICYDRWDAQPEITTTLEGGEEATIAAQPAGDLYSFRPSELHAFVLAGIAERQRRIEKRLQALEQGE